jgi:hypothetical protein
MAIVVDVNSHGKKWFLLVEFGRKYVPDFCWSVAFWDKVLSSLRERVSHVVSKRESSSPVLLVSSQIKLSLLIRGSVGLLCCLWIRFVCWWSEKCPRVLFLDLLFGVWCCFRALRQVFCDVEKACAALDILTPFLVVERDEWFWLRPGSA